ncbi:MAG: hypothetical protein OXT65_02345 [Alphaproteobacteria bacterium]|nr:hypothetical protein [Alphaproteobacteria bacterium]
MKDMGPRYEKRKLSSGFGRVAGRIKRGLQRYSWPIIPLAVAGTPVYLSHLDRQQQEDVMKVAVEDIYGDKADWISRNNGNASSEFTVALKHGTTAKEAGMVVQVDTEAVEQADIPKKCADMDAEASYVAKVGTEAITGKYTSTAVLVCRLPGDKYKIGL